MTVEEADIFEQAILWHLRLPDASADEWRSFIEWLEASPAHAATYDQLTLEDLSIVPPFEPGRPLGADHVANDRWPRRRRWILQSAAALLVAGLLFGGLSLLVRPARSPSTPYVVATAPGETRTIRLGDGTSIDLNGGTRLVLDRENARFASLETGEAIFRVNHDAASPFTLRSGNIELRDLGTVFNVNRQGQRLTVEVSDGAVMFQPERESVILRPGTQLIVRGDEDKVVIGHVDKASVGSWIRGWIVLHDTPVSEAANAIERATGARIVVAPELADKPFTGSIRLSGGAGDTISRFAQLLDARSAYAEGTWALTPRHHEVHPG